MSALLIRLRPTSPWRIGPDSGDRDRVGRIYHSDALFGAVTSAMSALGQLNEWLQATVQAAEPAVRFSSCFPFQGQTLFVVPPQHIWPPAPSAKIRWKGARFVPVKVVEVLLAGESLNEDAWAIDTASECLVSTASGVAASPVFRATVRPNAAMDRHGEGALAHSSACLEFAPGGGLWFAAEFASDAARSEWRGPLEGALRLLADSGFGGERSRGWGRCEMPEIVEGSLPELLWRRTPVTPETVTPEAQTGHWLLSLFHPAMAENGFDHGFERVLDHVDWQQGNYSTVTRAGRVESLAGWGNRKRDTRMIAEGSVLVAPETPRGTATNVAPEGFAHPVYRAGFALSLPVPLVVTKLLVTGKVST